jgi:hypothetical protein
MSKAAIGTFGENRANSTEKVPLLVSRVAEKESVAVVFLFGECMRNGSTLTALVQRIPKSRQSRKTDCNGF